MSVVLDVDVAYAAFSQVWTIIWDIDGGLIASMIVVLVALGLTGGVFLMLQKT